VIQYARLRWRLAAWSLLLTIGCTSGGTSGGGQSSPSPTLPSASVSRPPPSVLAKAPLLKTACGPADYTVLIVVSDGAATYDKTYLPVDLSHGTRTIVWINRDSRSLTRSHSIVVTDGVQAFVAPSIPNLSVKPDQSISSDPRCTRLAFSLDRFSRPLPLTFAVHDQETVLGSDVRHTEQGRICFMSQAPCQP
jgi:hypothetical protein